MYRYTILFFFENKFYELLFSHCDQLHLADPKLVDDSKVPCMSTETADSLTEVVDVETPGQVNYSSGKVGVVLVLVIYYVIKSSDHLGFVAAPLFSGCQNRRADFGKGGYAANTVETVRGFQFAGVVFFRSRYG